MKRLISLLLVLCLSFGMVACSSEEAEPESTSGSGTSIIATVPTSEVATEPTETNPIETEPVETEPKLPYLEEVVVYDDGVFKLTAKEIDYSDKYSVDIKFLAENNSDKNVSFSGDYFTINGITMYCSFYIQVAAGKKANDRLEIRRDDLEEFGIEQISTIVAQDAYIYDSDEYSRILDFNFTLSTSIADTYQQQIDNGGQVIYDKDGIVVKYCGVVDNGYGREELKFYIENSTDQNVNITVDNVSVNGFMVYGSMVAYAYSECVTYDRLEFSASDMEENDISKIEEVSFSLRAYDQETYRTIWETEEITLTREIAE